jgi:hypothetical protein
VVTEPPGTMASRDRADAGRHAVVFEIDSVTGRSLDGPDVMFAAGTRFLVTDVRAAPAAGQPAVVRLAELMFADMVAAVQPVPGLFTVGLEDLDAVMRSRG